MKKIYFLQRLRKVFLHSFLMLLLFSFFTGKINAQTYVNGNLNTGPTTTGGATAPAGSNWSELQLTNTTLGAGASIAAGAGFTVADDFTVTGAQPWNLTSLTVYAYSTGYAGATSPFTDVRVQIYNGDPSAGGTVIFGDLTTNRLASTSAAGLYRTAAAGATNRIIWKIDAGISTVLTPGTYWVEYQMGTALASNFSPPSTVVGATTQPGYNALQRTLATNTWAPLTDGGSGAALDMPFTISYTTGLCSGTPVPGNTISSTASVCPGLSVNLSLQNTTSGSGVTYQWQSSTSLGGPYTNIAGATNATYSTTQTVPTYYQAIVSCSGSPGTSVPVFVDMTPQSGCYCTAGSTDTDPNFEKIDNVQFGTLSNASTSFAGYEDFTALTPVASFAAGLAVPITITGNANTYGGDVVKVWIDLNQNGNYNDPGENVYTSGQSAGPYNGVITFPVNTTVGNTRMRIRMYDDIFGNGNSTPCGDNTYGQVEDYTINITPCIPGTITTQPANKTSYCSGNVSFTVAANGTGLTYQWQERPNATSPWVIVANGGIYSGATTATLTLTNLTTASNGHQFQVAVGGPCTPVFLSSVATLTVGPLVANVSPASATICAGSSTALSIITTAPPTTQTYCSGPITVAIPDNDPVGGNSTIAVSTIPAGAIITGISVKFTLSHTYSGDVAAVLKAPNGNILNLDYFITATGNAGTGFINTVISSQTVPPLPFLSSSSSPYTATFQPDAQLTIPAGFPPAGPTGFIPNVDNFPALYSVGNGNWTFAAYDAFALDAGVLTSWCIDITYGAPFAGIWTGTNIFNDPALTSPYTGTLANTVYVAPTATTNYTVSISTPNCTSTPTTIPVTVANAVGGTIIASPANNAVCLGSNTSFTVSGATGGPFTYQWQVSTDGGATWNNVSGAVYSGATTATLTLTNPPLSYSTYQYRAVVTVASCSTSANSAAATLTVNPLPVVTAASSLSSLYPGLVSTITATSNPAAATYQWYLNGVLIPGATNATVQATVDGLGDYTVEVTDVNGCTNTSNATTITSAPNDIMFIYPSPNTGQFQVRYYNTPGNASNVRTLTIYDSKGARVYSRSYDVNVPYTRMDVDMTNYSKGIYRVELGDRNGKRIKTGSVIVL